MPELDRLTLPELRALLDALAALAAAGGILAGAGLSPVYHLAPGWRMGIVVDAMMPRAAPDDVDNADTGRAMPGDMPAGTPAAPPPAAAEGTLPPDDATRAQGGADGPIYIAPVDIAPVADDPPDPPAAGGGAPNWLSPVWTDAEDRRLADLKAEGQSVAAIAATLGRSVSSVNTRWNRVVKMRRDPDWPSAAAPRPAPPPASPVALAGAPTCLALIRADLNALGHKRPWTPALDLKLVLDMAGGAHLSEVAADLGFDIRVVKDRWQALSAIGGGRRQTLIDVLRARAEPAAAAE